MEGINLDFNRYYISVDERGRIVDGFSDAFRNPSETDICINERGEYHFRLFPDGEANPPLYELEHLVPLYEFKGGEVRPRRGEDIEADIAALPVPEYVPTEERVTELEYNTAALEEALCEMDIHNEERIAAIEEALCEIDMG